MSGLVPRGVPGLGVLIVVVLSLGCERDQLAPPPALGRSGEWLTVRDSGALQSGVTWRNAVQPLQASGVVSIHAGETAVVRVASVSTSRCESVGVSGAITQALFSAVGVCGGVGLTATIGPAMADGSLFFSLTSSPSSEAMVTGSFPSYTVGLDDGLYDFDFNDVVLTVAILAPCPPEQIGDPLLESAEVRLGLLDALAASHPELPPGSRVEVGGLIWRRSDGSSFTSLVPPGPGTTECHFDGSYADGVQHPPEPGAQAVGKFHTHPAITGDPVYGCPMTGGTRFAQFPGDRGDVPRARPDWNGGGSDADWDSGTSDGFPMYVISTERRVYRLDPGVGRSQRRLNPNRWQQPNPPDACFRRRP